VDEGPVREGVVNEHIVEPRGVLAEAEDAGWLLFEAVLLAPSTDVDDDEAEAVA
jgi:hypothetical protein